MRENNHPGPHPVYHGRPREVPRLIAFCEPGLPEHHYLPHALGDDIVYAWGLQTRGEVSLYLLPDPEDGDDGDAAPRGAVAGPFRTLEEAYGTCTERLHETPHVVVL